MSELMNLQNKFQAYLMHSDAQIEQSIVATKNVPVAVRLDIYGNAYRSRLLEALEATYPALKIYMGDDEFYKIGHEYLDKYPSSYRSIRWFGDQLPAFMKEHIPYRDQPQAAELAALEWTMTLVFDAADSDVLEIDEMNTIPPDAWESMQLHFHPTVHCLKLRWNVVEFWQAIMEDQAPPELVQTHLPNNWVLWRKDLLNYDCPINEDEAWAIAAMAKGCTFGELCEGLCQWTDEQDAVTRAATLLKDWIIAGLVQKILIRS
jgi:hypothetical protein